MALSISNIVNVQLNTVPKSAARKDFGIVALFTPESGNIFTDKSTRYAYVENQADVENMFGSNSETAKASLPFFAQSPRAKQLIVFRWQKARSTIEATSNALNGAVVSNTLDEFKRVVNGCFSLTIGTQKKQIKDLNFSECADFNAVAAKITEKLTALTANVTATYDETGKRFLLTANAAGANADTLIFYAQQDDAAGTYVGSMLKLEEGQAGRVIGAERVVLQAETLGEALLKAVDVNNSWYGFTFAAQLTDDQVESAAKFAQANTKLFGANVIREDQLEWTGSNIYKKLADAGLDHTLAIFDKNDMYPCSSAMARLLAMNFAANNSTITLKFKQQPTITADEITLTEFNKAKRLGINIYTYFDDVAMIAEGTVIGGKFADEIVILDWFKDAVQKEVFSRLYKSPTKLPLTDRGQAVLISAVEKVCIEGVNNGAFAPGKWNGDGFGSISTGDYLDAGYYVYAAPMDTLSDSDREQRKATPIQTAVKLAGAIHSSDVIINFNR
nr:MAG TPA: tail sheath protein [Caudoviricetes sp.]